MLAPDFVSQPLGTIGIEAGQDAWHRVATRFPEMRVVADDILVDGDTVAVRSSVHGTGDGAHADGDLPHRHGRLAELWGITEGPRPR